jgi:hypothetical protein
MKYRLFAYTLGWPPHRRDPSQEKLCGQIPASMLERAIQERLGRANLGLNVRHDLDIEPATRSVPSLPGNVCSTRSDGLLIGYKVARQFESHPLQRKVPIVVPELRADKNVLPPDLALLEHPPHCFAHVFFISVSTRFTRYFHNSESMLARLNVVKV